MTTKIELKAPHITGLQAAPKGKRPITWDALVQGFGVRVTDKGAKSFILSAKLRDKANTQIFTIGSTDKYTLSEARKIACDWLIQIRDGGNPVETQAAAKVARVEQAEVSANNCFRARAEKWIATGLTHLRPRTLTDIRGSMENKFYPVWGERQIETITSLEIADLIQQIAVERGRGAARTALSHLKQFFNWLVGGAGVLQFSPCAVISGKKMLGKAGKRSRVLTDDELAQVWHGATKLNDPLRQIYHLLILTGCRRNEVVHAQWSEIDLVRKVWVISADRMKAKKDHVIPLTQMMIDIIESLPGRGEEKYVFPNGVGNPLKFGEREKSYIDKACGLTGWVNHDLRRTMRTGLAPKAMGIPFHIAEMMVAHVQNEVVSTYDLFEYVDEKRAGFQAWSDKVARIAGLNVVTLAA